MFPKYVFHHDVSTGFLSTGRYIHTTIHSPGDLGWIIIQCNEYITSTYLAAAAA